MKSHLKYPKKMLVKNFTIYRLGADFSVIRTAVNHVTKPLHRSIS